MTDDVSDISDLPEEMQPHIMVDALYNERDRWQSDLDKHVMENNAMIVNNYISRYRTRRSRKSGLYIFVVVLFLIGLAFALGGCISNDKSILVKEGDDQLDCPALAKEYDHADSLGVNKAARQRHIRSLQRAKACAIPPRVTISIGVTKMFN